MLNRLSQPRWTDCPYCRRRHCLVCDSSIKVYSTDGVLNWQRHERTQKHRHALVELYTPSRENEPSERTQS